MVKNHWRRARLSALGVENLVFATTYSDYLGSQEGIDGRRGP